MIHDTSLPGKTIVPSGLRQRSEYRGRTKMFVINSVLGRVAAAAIVAGVSGWMMWPTADPHLSTASDNSTPPEFEVEPEHVDLAHEPAVAALTSTAAAANDTTAGPAPASSLSGIIGETDDRRPVPYPHPFPASAMVHIVTDSGVRQCSGWLYGDNTVATAGHCVYDNIARRWATLAKVRVASTVKAIDPAEAYHPPCGALRLYTTDGWIRGREGDREEYDYGAIKLDCDLGRRVGKLRPARITAPWPPGRIPFAFGYDGNVTEQKCEVPGPVTQLCYARGTTSSVSAGMLYYDIDSEPTASGGAILIPALCQTCVVAIHTRSRHGTGPHAGLNHGVAITERVFRNLWVWLNAR